METPANMHEVRTKIHALNWLEIAETLDCQGYALIKEFINGHQCKTLRKGYNQRTLYRKTVNMERHSFGIGEYKYFQYPLPTLIQTIRENVYPYLVPLVNAWMANLGIEKKFPANLSEFIKECKINNQLVPTPLILKYKRGGFNTLHQDLYGEVYFPIQMVMMLSKPNTDYKGGEFVITEQIPRAQSKAIVLTPGQGDMLLFASNFRPIKSKKSYYRAKMRHGISKILEGERLAAGIIFHDAEK